MKCPFCGTVKRSVLDTRWKEDGNIRRRRYKCENNHRYTSYEMLDEKSRRLAFDYHLKKRRKNS